LRYAEYINQNFLPMKFDELSYGGRQLVYFPLFYYILAIFNFIMPMELVGKIIPNLFASCLIFVVYLITVEITKNKGAGIFTALLSGFIPLFYSETIFSVSIYTLVIPLTFLCLYFFLRISDDPNSVVPFLLVMALLRYTHVLVILFVIALFFYLILISTENLKQRRSEIEIILFVMFLGTWSLFISYKNVFLLYGPFVLWQNIPQNLLSTLFSDITLLETMHRIGIIPIICGVYIVYKYMFKEKNRSIYLLISFVVLLFFLLFFKLIQLNTGLIFLGVILVLLFAQFYDNFFKYIQKTRFAWYKHIILLILGIAFVFTQFIPSIYYALYDTKSLVSDSEINAFLWLKENSGQDDVILTTVSEGYLAPYFAERKNVIDPNFLLIDDIDERYTDVKTIYTTSFITEAIKLLNKYQITYIYFSPRAKREFGTEKLMFLEGSCFEKVYSEEVEIYKSLCRLQEK
jgi:hypothetical protein